MNRNRDGNMKETSEQLRRQDDWPAKRWNEVKNELKWGEEMEADQTKFKAHIHVHMTL